MLGITRESVDMEKFRTILEKHLKQVNEEHPEMGETGKLSLYAASVTGVMFSFLLEIIEFNNAQIEKDLKSLGVLPSSAEQ